jgi:predicted nucleic acid-binding Zn ribbon protein
MKKQKSIGDLIKDVIKDLGKTSRLSEEDMMGAWKDAAGEAAARHTRPVSFRKSSLIVNVDGSSWLYELTLKKKEILKKLEGRLKGKKLKDIRFRIGDTKK